MVIRMRTLAILKGACTLAVAAVLLSSVTAGALSPAQKRTLDSGADYFNVDVQSCGLGSGNRTGGITPGPIYVLGDSITVGMRDSGDLAEKMTAAGWQPTINAVGGKMLNWGLDQVVADKDTIAASQAILVGLGTNNVGDVVKNDGSSTLLGGAKDTVKEDVQAIVDVVRETKADIPIFWTDVYISGLLTTEYGTFDMDAAMPIINQAIYEVDVETENFFIIPWSTSTEAPVFTAGDGIHPSGYYPETADFIVSNLAGGAVVSGGTIPASGTMPLSGLDNQEKIWYFLRLAGLSENQAAGLMGNIEEESGFNPAADQGGAGGPSGEYNNAYGIVQWDGGRRVALENAAASQGVDVSDLSFQLIYMYNESLGRSVRNKQPPGGAFVNPNPDTTANEWEGLKLMASIADAARYWNWNFERSADVAAGIQERVAAGELILAQFSGQAVPLAGAGGCTESGGNILPSVDGYSWPLAPAEKIAFSNVPCSNLTTGCHWDGTAAVDLSYESVTGADVYAIYNGKIERISEKDPGWCYSIQFAGDDGKYYFYGHLIDVQVSEGETVTSGQVIARVADWTAEHTCEGTSSGDHLHIDRGCFRDEAWQYGGNDPCRDPEFIQLINQLWESLPEPTS